MAEKQQQQWKEDVVNKPSHREGGATFMWRASKRRCALIRRFVVLMLFIKLNKYFILFILSSPLFECQVLCQCPPLPVAVCHKHLCWPPLPSILHCHCPTLALALAYTGRWSTSRVSFIGLLCAASFVLVLAALRLQLQAPQMSSSTTFCCLIPPPTSSCPSLSEWPSLLQLHPLK